MGEIQNQVNNIISQAGYLSGLKKVSETNKKATKAYTEALKSNIIEKKDLKNSLNNIADSINENNRKLEEEGGTNRVNPEQVGDVKLPGYTSVSPDKEFSKEEEDALLKEIEEETSSEYDPKKDKEKILNDLGYKDYDDNFTDKAINRVIESNNSRTKQSDMVNKIKQALFEKGRK